MNLLTRAFRHNSRPYSVEFLCTDPLLPSGWYRFPMFRGRKAYDDPVGPFETYEQAVLGHNEVEHA